MTTLIATTGIISNPNQPTDLRVPAYDTYAKATRMIAKVPAHLVRHATHNGGSTETRFVQWHQNDTHIFRFVIE